MEAYGCCVRVFPWATDRSSRPSVASTITMVTTGQQEQQQQSLRLVASAQRKAGGPLCCLLCYGAAMHCCMPLSRGRMSNLSTATSQSPLSRMLCFSRIAFKPYYWFAFFYAYVSRCDRRPFFYIPPLGPTYPLSGAQIAAWWNIAN